MPKENLYQKMSHDLEYGDPIEKLRVRHIFEVIRTQGSLFEGVKFARYSPPPKGFLEFTLPEVGILHIPYTYNKILFHQVVQALGEKVFETKNKMYQSLDPAFGIVLNVSFEDLEILYENLSPSSVYEAIHHARQAQAKHKATSIISMGTSVPYVHCELCRGTPCNCL